jgi:transcriptional regulator with XRE-family HTH domain
MKIFNMTIGEIFKTIRTAGGWGQEDFSKLVGMAQGTISSIENGVTKNPSYDLLQALIFKVGANPLFVFNIDTTVDPIMHPAIITSRLSGKSQDSIKATIIKEIEESLVKLKSLKD